MDSDSSDVDEAHSKSSTSSLISILDEDDLTCNSDLPGINLTFSFTKTGSSSALNNETSDEDRSILNEDLSELVANASHLDLNENYNHSKGEIETNIECLDSKDNCYLHKDASGKDPCENLTAWEKWVINKAKQKRLVMNKKKKVALLNLEKEKNTKKLKEERQKKFDELFAIKAKEWNAKLSRTNLTKSASERSFRKVSVEKINENCKKWMDEKLQKLKDAKKMEKVARNARFLEEKEKREKALESYNAWLERNRSRKVKQEQSDADSEISIGHYVFGAYPEPEFVNPEPWTFQW